MTSIRRISVAVAMEAGAGIPAIPEAPSTLPIQQITLVFKELRYFVNVGKGAKGANASDSNPNKLELLKVRSRYSLF